MTTQEEELTMLKEIYREELLANQNEWLVKRISQAIPDLDIRQPSHEVGWSWTYHCFEQESDCCPTAMDALLDFLKTHMHGIDQSLGVKDADGNK